MKVVYSFFAMPALLLAASLSLVACSDDSSTSANGNDVILSDDSHEESSAASSTDVILSSSNEGSSAVTSSSSSSVIPGTDPESPASSSATVILGSSSSVILSSSEGSSAASSSNDEELMACTSSQEGYTKTSWTTTSEAIKYKCIDGYWIPQSSSSAASSSSYFDMTNQFSDKYSYGEFTDPRDGQVYRTVTYAWGLWGVDSVTFFAQNLNYGKMVTGGFVQADSNKYCYNDDSWYCDNGFGGLYSWSNAMNFPRACDSAGVGTDACLSNFVYTHDNGLQHDDDLPEDSDYIQHQGICPSGWHVMSKGEWDILGEKISDNTTIFYYFGSAVNYGENTYGFSILLGGAYLAEFYGIRTEVDFWLPQERSTNSLKGSVVTMTKSTYQRDIASPKTNGSYVRCVKDY